MEACIDHPDVLIVDADNARPDALHRLLANAALQLRGARDAAAAIESAHELPADLIIVDARSPALDGFEVCRELRVLPATSRTPILLVGALDRAGDVARARDCGASDVLRVPFDTELLQLRIDALLALARAQSLQRETSELLASMGHEIRTPMTAILGMSHLALQSGLAPKQRNYIEKVERSAELLLGTLTDVLDFSNIGAGKLELQHTPFHLSDAIDAVARLLAMKADSKGLELLIDAAADLPEALIGDGARLRQVLIDLGSHAVRSMKHGEIVLSVERGAPLARGVQLRFKVRGSDAIQMPRRDAVAASSLEIAICQHLIRLMGSTLTVDDGALTFAADFDVQASPVAAVPAPPYADRDWRVLIVDDNPRVREVLAAMCTSLGLGADGAIDGWDALRQASLARQAGRRHALALLDAQMTGMDAAECARQLARGEIGVPAILLAGAFGRDDVTQRLAAQHVTVRGVLTKPLTVAALRIALAAVLPLSDAEPSPVAAPASNTELLRQHRDQLRGARLLLVDDNAIMQEIALELLGSAGIRVQVAHNGAEALQRLSTQTFDGVLMDCQMPVMDGFEATRALRQRLSLKALPVIALTADSLEGDRERVLKAGMTDHIGKPFEVEQMFATLARWIHPVAAPASAPSAPAAAAPARDADPLARLPGIDARIGRNSTMSNDALYRRLLGMYREGQRNFGAQFAAARAGGDHATALRLVHNLRATSGSLGAAAVQQSARALETACARGSDDAEITELLDTVISDLDPVITGLGELT